MTDIENIKKPEGFQGQKAVIIPKKILAQKCIKNNIINNLYLTDIGYYPKAKFHYKQRLHGADQHILIYCHKGEGTATIKSTIYQIKAGDYIIIPTKTAHEYEADKNNPWTIFWLHFKGNISHSIVSLLRKQTGGGYKGLIKNNEKTLSLFNEMYSQLERGYSTDNLMFTDMCLWHFLTTFIYNDKYIETDELKVRDAIDLTIDLLGKRVNKTLTLKEIANEVNLSSSHFSYIFKKKTGFSPIEYFNQLKVQKACQYLLFTNLRIKEIAQQVGFNDPYYFSRLFTKIMGIAPNEYRNNKLL